MANSPKKLRARPGKIGYTPDWDLHTIPEPALKTEWARRSSLKRKTFSGPKKTVSDPKVAAELERKAAYMRDYRRNRPKK